MRIGNYSVPHYHIKDIVVDVKRLHEQYGRREFNKTDIAYTLGQSPTSGSLMQKIADMKSYGLLEGRGDSFNVTQLGEHATFGDSNEKIKALKTIFINIPLWNNLYEKYKGSIREDGFANILANLSGSTVPECEKKAPSLRKQYLGDLNFIQSVEGSEKAKDPVIIGVRADEDIVKIEPEINTTRQVTSEVPTQVGQFPSLYDPELSSPIIIRNVKTYKAAKVFWEDISAKWEKIILEGQSKDETLE